MNVIIPIFWDEEEVRDVMQYIITEAFSLTPVNLDRAGL